MNLTNVNKAIAVMERVKARGDTLDMGCWQGFTGEAAVATEAEAHTCGTAACFGGWVAVSPEFRADGGWANHDTGDPRLGDQCGPMAIAEWLGISDNHASGICGIHSCLNTYGVESVVEVTVDHVLGVLYKLRDGDQS